MKLTSKLLLFFMVGILSITLSACNSPAATNTGEEGMYIIDAKAAMDLSTEEVIFVDMQTAEGYAKEHVKGAVNIDRSDIMIDQPVANMLAPKEKIEEVLGSNGISNDTTVMIYDNTNNMDAARLWWTLMVYGHENMKVVSGGIKALKEAGAELTADKPLVTTVKYSAKDKNTDMIADIDDVKAQVNDPKKDVVLLDTRTQEEFKQGSIPGSILLDYESNNYKDGTYKSIQDIKIQYIENQITPDKTTIMYCKTSVRAAQTYLALYNAGYRNLKLYDGAWLEWSAASSMPVQTPSENKVESSQKDNS